MKKFSVISKIIIIFMIIFGLENNYVTYIASAVGNSGIIADEMDKYVEDNILSKLENKDSTDWTYDDCKIDFETQGYPSNYNEKYKEYYQEYIDAFNGTLLQKAGEGYTKLSNAIDEAKKTARTKAFDNEQEKALETGEKISDTTKNNNNNNNNTNESRGTASTSLDDIIENGKSFLQLGKTDVIEESELKSLSDFVSGILLWIAVAVTLITAIVMGITFLTQSIEDKAKVKESLTPWVIGIIISFGAYTIWKVTIAVFSSL